MSKLLNAFTVNGNLDAELWYTLLFDEIPCYYVVSVEDESKQLDIKEITFDKCKHLFKDVITYRQYTEDTEDVPEIEEIEFSDLPIVIGDDDILNFNGDAVCSLYVITKQRIFGITYNKCRVYYSPNDNLEEIKKFVTELWACFPKEEPQEKLARVGLIKYSQGEYYTSFSNIRKTHINIEENYNDDFLPVYKDMIDFLNQRESGLILAWGNPGTGNYYIKIIWNFQSNCVPLCYANTTQLHRGTSS